jgi:transposase
MLSFGGIDVSKDRLDITVLPDEQCSSSNDAAGWAELIEQLRGSSITAIGVEASGGYERGVVRAPIPQRSEDRAGEATKGP